MGTSAQKLGQTVAKETGKTVRRVAGDVPKTAESLTMPLLIAGAYQIQQFLNETSWSQLCN